MISDFAGLGLENSSNKYNTIYSNIKTAVMQGVIK